MNEKWSNEIKVSNVLMVTCGIKMQAKDAPAVASSKKLLKLYFFNHLKNGKICSA
jgi:hypothetical protein